jgi:hypothetical protein
MKASYLRGPRLGLTFASEQRRTNEFEQASSEGKIIVYYEHMVAL